MEETERRGAPLSDQRLSPIVRTVQWSAAENMLRQTPPLLLCHPPIIPHRPTDSTARREGEHQG